MVCDWVQYKQSFRDVVDVRPILSSDGTGTGPTPTPISVRDDDLEVAVDLRRSGGVALKELTAARLGADPGARVHLEDWGPGSRSCIWDFNALYWSHLRLWEEATGRGYEQALPGGESDARNRDGARALIDELFAVWDGLAARRRVARRALRRRARRGQRQPGQGLARRVPRPRPRARTRLLPAPALPDVRLLPARPRPRAGDRRRARDHVSSFVLDATRPRTSLGFLRSRSSSSTSPTSTTTCPPTRSPSSAAGPTACRPARYLPAAPAAEIAAQVHAEPCELAGPGAQAAAPGTRAARRRRARPRPGPRRGRRLLAPCLGGAPPRGALRPARRARPLRAGAGRQRRDAAPAAGVRRRPADARQQRRARELRRHPPAAAPLREAGVPRPVRHRDPGLPHALPWAREVRRLGGQLGQRPVAGPRRPPAGLRRAATRRSRTAAAATS